MTAPLISVVIPIYNSVKYIEKCLYSVANQSYRNLQIVCVDDGSVDGSSEIAKRICSTDSRFVFLHERNHGESYARNTGLSLCKGDYICFVDCDDFIEKEMYKTLIKVALDTDADITACGWIKEFSDHSVKMANKHKVEGPQISKQEFIHHVYLRDEYQAFAYMWNKLFKRSMLIDTEGKLKIKFDEIIRLGGDVLFMAEVMLSSNCFAFVDESFYHYTQRLDSTTHSLNLDLKKDQIKTYEKIINIFLKLGVEEETVKLVKRFCAYHSSTLAELALKLEDYDSLKFAQGIILKYYNVYVETNKSHFDRIKRIEELLNL